MSAPSGPNQPEQQYPPHRPLTDYYGTPADRADYVLDIFNKSAAHYDTIEKLFFNAGLHYRRLSLKFNGLSSGMKVLDVAIGTAAVSKGAVRVVGPAGPTITNSILYGNPLGDLDDASGVATVSYSDIGGSGVWPGLGNINLDPAFEAGGYQLSTSSPCVDAADNTVVEPTIREDLGTSP